MEEYFVKGLPDYSKETLIKEIQRVAAQIESQYISTSSFNKISRVHTSTIGRKFGGWENALKEAGLIDRYIGKSVTDKMKTQLGRNVGNDEFLDEIRRIAQKLNKSSITHSDFNENSSFSSSTVANRFGNWDTALKAAGLDSHIRPLLTEHDLFENILKVWTYYGRQPKYKEMNKAPSTISGGTYENKFGSWMGALHTFETYTRGEVKITEQPKQVEIKQQQEKFVKPNNEDSRDISLGLRYKVLKRDRFRCVKCGRSPATESNVILHIDHIIPFSLGGKTLIDNLQVCCSDCNLGKGNRDNE